MQQANVKSTSEAVNVNINVSLTQSFSQRGGSPGEISFESLSCSRPFVQQSSSVPDIVFRQCQIATFTAGELWGSGRYRDRLSQVTLVSASRDSVVPFGMLMLSTLIGQEVKTSPLFPVL